MPPDPAAAPPSRARLWLFGPVVAVGAGFVVTTGILSRERNDQRVREWTEAQAIPVVAVAPPGTRKLTPSSTCRAGSRPIRGRRSWPGSAAT